MMNFFQNNSLLLKFVVVYAFLILLVPVVDKFQNLLIFMGFIFIYMFFNNLKLSKMNEINQAKDTFVATMVHDLKNPLIGQKRLLEILMRKADCKNDEQLVELYSQIINSSKMMFEMVMSILNTYKYNNGKIQYNFQECDLVELVKETCVDLTHLTPNEKLLKLDVNSDIKTITADKMHLKRVVSNLLSNAIYHRKEDTPIFVNIKEESNNYKFSVTNSGYYIKPELQKEIFQKFVSKNTKFNKVTTGLGLYLSKEIVKAHNGKMIVNSTLDGKNTFGFTIPKNTFNDFYEEDECISNI